MFLCKKLMMKPSLFAECLDIEAANWVLSLADMPNPPQDRFQATQVLFEQHLMYEMETAGATATLQNYRACMERFQHPAMLELATRQDVLEPFLDEVLRNLENETQMEEEKMLHLQFLVSAWSRAVESWTVQVLRCLW